MLRRRAACAATVAAASLALPPAAPSQPPARFGSDITVVTVPVFVTNKNGKAVSGLRPSDFEIADEGKSVPIVGFHEVDVDDPASALALRGSLAGRRQFLLLFDLSFSDVSGLVRSRTSAIEFVMKKMAATDLGAVATFSANHGVRLLVGFTSDRLQLKKAIETLGVLQLDRRADPLGLAYDLTDVGAAMADAVSEPGASPVGIGDTLRAIQIRYEASQQAQYRQRVLAFVDGMAQLAKALDAVQGRKQVILLSSGFDSTMLTGQTGSQAARDSESVAAGRVWEVQSDNRFGDAQLRQEMGAMLKSFASSDSLVHAVDLAGLAARGDTRQTSSEPARRSGTESLAEIANLSGGRLFKDTNDLGMAFAEVAELSRHYYLLAFEPAMVKGPGKFHRLKVRLKGKAGTLSHRSGYFERSPFAERTALARRFEAADLVAKGVSGGDIALSAVAVPYRSATGAATLPVVLEASPEAFAKGGSKMGLELYGYALDEHGTVEDMVAIATNLDLARVGAQLRHGLQLHATFTLPAGRHTLRFLVRDSETGRTGAHFMEVTVPAFDPSEVMLAPPMLVEDPAPWLIVNATSRASAGPASPFAVGDAAFTPRPAGRLRLGQAASVLLIAYDAGRQYDPGASFEIKPALLDAAGIQVPAGKFILVKAAAGADGFRRFLLQITPDGIAPGPYTLRVRLRDPASGRMSEAFRAVQVD
jgi:VWFA-related protein